MYVIIFIEDFPTVDFVILPTETYRRNTGLMPLASIFSFFYGIQMILRNLAVVLGSAALAVVAIG